MTEDKPINEPTITGVKCGNCGKVLEVDPTEASDKRQPCPDCGSTKRKFYESLSITIKSSGEGTFKFSSGIDVPNLLMKAVVIPGDKTDEGEIIIAVTEPWYDILKLLEKDPSIAFKITPRKWEEIIAGAYRKAGFEVTLTPRSGDYGRDIIAEIKGIGEIRIIDDVKAYKPGHFVTAKEVRALMGVLQGDGASKGFITTTSDFAPTLREDPFIKPFLGNRIELVNGEMLFKRLKELRGKK